MPPSLDVQTFRPVAGMEWRWIDTAPDHGFTFGAVGMGSFDLLSASDSDESWRVSKALLDGVPVAAYRRGPLALVVDVPLRAEWNDSLGIADPRAGLLVSAGSWGTLRGSVIEPLGTLGWPYSWQERRWEAGASISVGAFGAQAAYLWGEAGSVLRGAVGADLGGVRMEAAGSYGAVAERLTLASCEVTASTERRVRAWSLAPFVSVGVWPGVGSPSGRVGVTALRRREPPVARPVPPPQPAPPPVSPVVEPAPPPVSPVVEPAPPPLPVVEPTPAPVSPIVEQAPPPVVEPTLVYPKPVRVRIELHPACKARPDEFARMLDMEAQARAFVRAQGVGEEGITVVAAKCRVKRGVELVVVEVR
jgi:hypothetical protein